MLNKLLKIIDGIKECYLLFVTSIVWFIDPFVWAAGFAFDKICMYTARYILKFLRIPLVVRFIRLPIPNRIFFKITDMYLARARWREETGEKNVFELWRVFNEEEKIDFVSSFIILSFVNWTFMYVIISALASYKFLVIRPSIAKFFWIVKIT